MNIYLTSYGLDTRYEYMNSYDSIIKLLNNNKVAIIPNAKLITEDRSNSKVAKDELLKNNIEADIIDLDKDVLDFNKYTAIYLSGGEPKNLMSSIINNNLVESFNTFINKGGIIIGQSAGAMIFCKDYYDTTTGELLMCHDGFNYSDKIIVPHYDNLPNELKDKMVNDLLTINDKDDLIKIS